MSEREELIRQFLDGELDGERERKALHEIAESEELRELLRFERSLSLLRSGPVASVPEGFSDSVMRAVSERSEVMIQPDPDTAKVPDTATSEREREERILDQLARLLDRMMTPISVSLRPAWAVVLLIAALLWAVNISVGPQNGPADGIATTDVPAETDTDGQATLSTRVVAESDDEVWIRFVYIDQDADHIAVAGDFTGWDPMDLDSEWVGARQVWTAVVRVPRGEHHYMFIRNGEEWLTDPFADTRRDDGFGNENAVLYL